LIGTGDDWACLDCWTSEQGEALVDPSVKLVDPEQEADVWARLDAPVMVAGGMDDDDVFAVADRGSWDPERERVRAKIRAEMDAYVPTARERELYGDDDGVAVASEDGHAARAWMFRV
jgi:hypothetical protein